MMRVVVGGGVQLQAGFDFGRSWMKQTVSGENKISPPWSLQTDKEVEGKLSKKQKIFIFDIK